MTYQDHVSAVFRSRCGSCHNPDKQKGGLNLDNYGSAMQGGGSGKVIEPGDAESSTLFLVVTHKEEPKMPPNSPKIPDAEIDVIRKWIEGGALENSGSVAAAKAKPKFEFKLDPAALGKPAGTPAMPENLSTEPFVPAGQARRRRGDGGEPLGPAGRGRRAQAGAALPDDRLPPGRRAALPRGAIYVLKFSRNGDLLLAGGGRGGQSGLAVAWDVKKGTRVFEVGKEYDVVLAADISPDHGQVALGGPEQGRPGLQHGRRLARLRDAQAHRVDHRRRVQPRRRPARHRRPQQRPDRLGGADRPRVLRPARPHRRPSPTSAGGSTRTSSPRPARTATVKLWEMENGGNIKNDRRPRRRGRPRSDSPRTAGCVTTGRDRVVRLWDQNGNKQREFEPFGDLALEAVFTSRRVAGHRRRLDRVRSGSGTPRTAAGWRTSRSIPPRSPSGSTRRARLLAAAQAEADSLSKQLAPLQNAAGAAQAVLAQVQAKVAAAEQAAPSRPPSIQQLDQALKAKVAAAAEARATLQAAEQLAAQTASAQISGRRGRSLSRSRPRRPRPRH